LHPLQARLEAAVVDSRRLSIQVALMGDPAWEKEPLLRGRYAEFRILCLLGKDILRWISQCADFADRDDELRQAGIHPQGFADLLVNGTPEAVAARFECWGVSGFGRVISRAIGINAVFPNPPGYAVISAEFLEQYYSYADSLYACYQSLAPPLRIDYRSFVFSLYTSDEYLDVLGCKTDEGD
jgi:hypothetical protein